MSRWIVRTFFSLLFFSPSWGQSELCFRNFTINDGLSQSSALCMVQDEVNSLWIGTQDGLNRYDGHAFQTYSSNDTKGLSSDYVRAAVRGKDGVLWFGTNSGLTSFDIRSESFKTYHDSGTNALDIIDLSVDRSGVVWIATVDKGLYTFNPSNSKLKSYLSEIPSKKTTQVLAVGKHVIVSAEGKGLFVMEGGRQTHLYSATVKRNDVIINNIRPWNDKKVLLATGKGVYIYDIEKHDMRKERISDELESFNVNATDVYCTQNKEWIIATKSEGLIVVEGDFTKQYTEDIFQKNALLINELNSIYSDNSGNVWIGSQRGISVFNIDDSGILGYGPSGNDQKGIPTSNVWSFAESKSGRYTFIGTDRAVSRWDRRTGAFKQFYRSKEQSTLGTGEMDVLNMHVISDNKLLIACADGAYELIIRADGYEFKQIQDPEMSAEFFKTYSILHWKGSKYFFATRGGVLMYDVQTKELSIFTHDPNNPGASLTDGICRVSYKDRYGNVWFATSVGGLSQLKEQNGEITIIPYRYNKQLRKASTDYITSIFVDKKGNYWLSTLGAGLIKWNEKTKKSKVYNEKDGLPNGVIYSVLEGSEGNLWLSTNKGLCSFSPSTGKVKVFTEQEGLMSNEFNLGAYMKGKDGYLYFGGIYGYNYFQPASLSRRKKDLSITFTKFKLENEWLTPGKEEVPLRAPIFKTKELFLDYRQNSFTLRFQPSDIGDGETVNYKYHLLGSDEGEIYHGSSNEIHFNALASGDYELLIYARRGNGEWSEVPARMKIHIASPFWRTWWFWTIIGVLALLGVRIFIRRRVDAARREQIRLEIKVKNRTREIQQQNQKIAAQKLKIEEERNKVVKQQKLLQIEKDKTEKLLKNVIPASTAEELKKRGKARARAYKTVSVLFTDFVGFTKISDKTQPTELVKKLDVYFTKFDEIIVKNNLEKIKTIGDAYMCAGGVPVRNNTNPIDTCLAAVQIQHYMTQRKNDAIANGSEYWELRLGINTGEVTAGVIGSERLAYDVWGATVNQAQRMEMLGAPGKVTISGATFELIEPYFDCTFKGKAQTKSRGLIDMYEVNRIKPELSENGEGIYPNKRFKEIVNLHLYSSINYYKAERYIMKLLDQQLSPKLHYHSVGHSKDVVNAVERIALLENVTDEALFLLKSAANYHDAGFIEQYDANEPVGARLAGEILPRFGYTQADINVIQELIYATRIPHDPQNHLQEILCDADLDYLGRDDFHEIADNLRRELKEHGKIQSDRQWDEIQVGFLKMHKYFTKTAIETRREKKMKHLKEVQERLERDEYED
ncbi:MAG: hypothetical protein DCO96_04275 [Fluviicola sp. XM-24bin1]|nr:MAG: hypothetical protein DCO96_04275 [Fluviicola sp. XM-24bin1]